MPKKCRLDEESIREAMKDYQFPGSDSILQDYDEKISKDTMAILWGELGFMQCAKDLVAMIKDAPYGQEIIRTKEYQTVMLDCLDKYVSMVRHIDMKECGGADVVWKDEWDKIEGVLKNMREGGDWVANKNIIAAIRNDKTTRVSTAYSILDTMINMLYAVTDAIQQGDLESRKTCALAWLEDDTLTRVRNQTIGELEKAKELTSSQIITDFYAGKYEELYRRLSDMTYGRNYDGALRAENQYATYEMNIQVSANSRHAIKVGLSCLRFEVVREKNVLSDKAANEMLDAIDTILKGMADFSGTLGSDQNRLQHAMEYAMEHAEIETSAESRMRDTNCGKEAVEHAKQNLQQEVQKTVFTEEKRAKEQSVQQMFSTPLLRS